MMVRSWYGSATLITSFGCTCLIRATSSGTLSASTRAVLMLPPSWAAMASHFEMVREARVISLKMSRRCAHLWVTTWPTPPAPMISILLIILIPSLIEWVGFELRIILIFATEHNSCNKKITKGADVVFQSNFILDLKLV